MRTTSAHQLISYSIVLPLIFINSFIYLFRFLCRRRRSHYSRGMASTHTHTQHTITAVITSITFIVYNVIIMGNNHHRITSVNDIPKRHRNANNRYISKRKVSRSSTIEHCTMCTLSVFARLYNLVTVHFQFLLNTRTHRNP